MPHPSVALSIAGSDCSAGAGIQADLKTFQHFQVHGLTAITCVVSETSRTVHAIEAMSPDFVDSQMALLLESFPVGAIKTGMLHSAAIIERVAKRLQQHCMPLVVDPIMIASSGTPLIESDGMAAYTTALFPLAFLITPNIPEAEALLGTPIHHPDEMANAARELSLRYSCNVLLKGGHLGGNVCVDVLYEQGRLHRFEEPRIPLPESHGTGCTLSAAICASLSQGIPLPDAVASAKSYLSQALRHAYHFPTGMVCLNQGTCIPTKPGDA